MKKIVFSIAFIALHFAACSHPGLYQQQQAQQMPANQPQAPQYAYEDPYANGEPVTEEYYEPVAAPQNNNNAQTNSTTTNIYIQSPQQTQPAQPAQPVYVPTQPVYVPTPVPTPTPVPAPIIQQPPVNTQPISPQPNYNPNHPAVLSNSEFASFLKSLEDVSFDDSRLNIIQSSAKRTAFTSQQVSSILKIISFDSTRVKAAIALYPATVDARNWHIIYRVIDFDSSTNEIEKSISNLQPLGH